MQRWLWVTLPDTYAAQPLPVGRTFTWTCHSATETGDIAVLYRADLFRDFSHVFRVDTDPYDDAQLRNEYDAPACDCTVVVALNPTIMLDAVRQDPVLRQWPAALVGFHGTAFPVEREEWQALIGLAAPNDRARLRAVGGR